MHAHDQRPPASEDDRTLADPHDRDRRPDPRDPIERRARTWSPWLVIRYKADDDGRVRPIPDGEVFWASPDIDVQSSAGTGQAVAGEPNTVRARVINLGKADGRPTRVDFYWADPSLGLGPAHMNYIGTKWIEASYHRATWAVCPTPWVPIMTNGGHECLFVNCTSDILNDTLQCPFQPQLDRRAGQRNVAVISAKAGEKVPFTVMVNNLAPMRATTVISVQTAHVAVARTALEAMRYQDMVNTVVSFHGGSASRGIVRHLDQPGTFSRSGPSVRSELSGPLGVVPSAGARRHFGNLLLNGPAPAARRHWEGGAPGPEVVLHDATMDAFEQRRLHLELGAPANAEAGDFTVVHLTHRIADLPVGGYTIALAL
jgi:hypothetical protein